jgi:alanyl-tRNA synthetase
LHTVPTEVTKRIDALNKTLREREKEIESLQAQISKVSVHNLADRAYDYNGVKIVIESAKSDDPNALRQNAEMIKDKLESSVVVLGSVIGDKVALVCFVTKDLLNRGLHAGKIIGAAAKVAGGGGGGRPDMAQAGGKDASKIDAALNLVAGIIESQVK